MAGIFNDIKSLYTRSNIASRYVMWNAGFFLAVIIFGFILNVLLTLNLGPIEAYLALNSEPMLLLKRPWGIITHMFNHWGLSHFIGNMISIYFGGTILLTLVGKEVFAKTYWLGGLFGALLMLVVINLLPDPEEINHLALGASAAAFSIWVTGAAYRPNHVVNLIFIGPAKLKYIALVSIILSLPINKLNMGGQLAHLGGILFGYYYGRNLAAGKDVAPWFDKIYHTVLSWFGPRKKKRNKHMKIVYDGPGSVPRDDHSYNQMKKAKQEQLDAILDKVGKSGYSSLSKSEKDTLDKSSKGI